MYGYELRPKFPRKCKSIDELALYLSNRPENQSNFSMLLGAGCSVTSNVKTGRDLVASWRRTYYEKFSGASPDSYDDEGAIQWLHENCSDWYNPEKEYASFFEYIFDTPGQRRIFVERQVHNAKPSIGYYFLSRLVNEKYINTIFTTNFDDLINDAFYRFGNTRPIVCAHDSSVEGILVTSPRPKIIKLHGDYLFDEIKCTANDTSSLDKNMKEKFRQFLREYGLIVMGYSGEDESVMSVLAELLEDPSYMKNGIYWCVKEESYVSKKVFDLLRHARVFPVFVDGFDSALARICEEVNISSETLPDFQNASGVDSLVKSWIDNRDRYVEEGALIKQQLDKLEMSQSKSQLGKALGDLYEENKGQKDFQDQLDDGQVAALVHLKKLYNQMKYFEALEYSKEKFRDSYSTDFQEALLLSDYDCWKELKDYYKAREVSQNLQKIDPSSPYHVLREFDIETNFIKKSRLIDKAIEKDKYLWSPYYKRAKYLVSCAKYGLSTISNDQFSIVSKSFERSIELRPSIKNPSWPSYIEFLIENKKRYSTNECVFEKINSVRLQDPYSPLVLRLIFDLCAKEKSHVAFGDSIFDIIRRALKEYFPNYSPCILRVAVDASIEFDKKDFAMEVCDEIENNVRNSDELFGSLSYIISKSDMYLDIYEDLSESIKYLAEASVKNVSPEISLKLLLLYLYSDDIDSARACLPKIKKMCGDEKYARCEMHFFDRVGEFARSQDIADSFKGMEFFDNRFSGRKTYSYLMQKNYRRAKIYSSEVLDKYSWNIDSFDDLIVNHEFACYMLDKPNKKRLDNLVKSSTSDQVKAMANLLLGNKEESEKIMRESIGKRYSWYYEYRCWPIIKELLPNYNKDFGDHAHCVRVV